MELVREANEDAASGRAARVDPDTGVREVAEFFGAGDEPIFGSRCAPHGDVVGRVVVCSSIHAELLANYRREVLLARALAARGFAVQRFHYRGTGHSAGDPAGVTFSGMVGDAMCAAERLDGHRDVPLTFVGTRWGALVAAAAARRSEGASLVLWEPVIEGQAFFREALRLRSIGTLTNRVTTTSGNGNGNGSEGTLGTEKIDIFGFDVHPALVEDAAGRTLLREVGSDVRRALLIQLSRKPKLGERYADLVDRWRENGTEVETEVVVEEAAWWFPDQPARGTSALIDFTSRWLERRARRPSP